MVGENEDQPDAQSADRKSFLPNAKHTTIQSKEAVPGRSPLTLRKRIFRHPAAPLQLVIFLSFFPIQR
jgi:hypothetical protein